MQPAAGAVGNDRIRIDQMDDVTVRAWQAGGFFFVDTASYGENF